jgi:hypothetical protein
MPGRHAKAGFFAEFYFDFHCFTFHFQLCQMAGIFVICVRRTGFIQGNPRMRRNRLEMLNTVVKYAHDYPLHRVRFGRD